jgi:hypothetical protein
MENEISIFRDQKAVTTAGEVTRYSTLGQKMADANVINSRRIQTNTNGTFKKVINGEQVGDAIRGEIDVIVVGMLTDVSRVFYKEKYDPNAVATLPNCWSNLGDAPEANVGDAQHANCAGCPQNIKGSGDNGTKACRYQRRLAVILPGDESGTVYQFSVPAKSLFGKGVGNVHPFESYIKFLLVNGMSPDLVITNVKYNLNAETMELQFTPVRQIDEAEYAIVQVAQAQPEAEMYTKITVAQADGVTKPAPVAQAEPVVTTTDAPVEEPVEVPAAQPIEEPVVREAEAQAKEEPPAESAVDSVLAEWGD